MRSLDRNAFHNPLCQAANGYGLPVAHRSSSPSLLKQWGEREMKAMRTKGQIATFRGRHATRLEQELSDIALRELKRRYPDHTDKYGARDADCSVDIIKSARKRGRLPLRHVMMLARTWGSGFTDFWECMFESEAASIAREIRLKHEIEKLSQEVEHLKEELKQPES